MKLRDLLKLHVRHTLPEMVCLFLSLRLLFLVVAGTSTSELSFLRRNSPGLSADERENGGVVIVERLIYTHTHTHTRHSPVIAAADGSVRGGESTDVLGESSLTLAGTVLFIDNLWT